jgi:hypothetical protein
MSHVLHSGCRAVPPFAIRRTGGRRRTQAGGPWWGGWSLSSRSKPRTPSQPAAPIVAIIRRIGFGTSDRAPGPAEDPTSSATQRDRHSLPLLPPGGGNRIPAKIPTVGDPEGPICRHPG